MADFGSAAQAAAEAHLDACNLAEEEYDEALTTGEDTAGMDSPACAPYCGCQTCVVREVLYAAVPVIVAGLADLLRDAGYIDAADHLTSQVPVTGPEDPDCE